MGQAETYQMISLICFGLAGVFLIAAIILFFKLRIVEVVGGMNRKDSQKADTSLPKRGGQKKTLLFSLTERKRLICRRYSRQWKKKNFVTRKARGDGSAY